MSGLPWGDVAFNVGEPILDNGGGGVWHLMERLLGELVCGVGRTLSPCLPQGQVFALLWTGREKCAVGGAAAVE